MAPFVGHHDARLVRLSSRRRQAKPLPVERERTQLLGKRQRILEGHLSVNAVLSLCLSVAHVTETTPIGSSIQPIYLRHASDLAQTASYLNEVSNGRFRLGLGVSHGPAHQRLGVSVGKPLSDMRGYVEAMRAAEPQAGPLPPLVLATLRDRMLDLAVEIADGAVWANGARSHMSKQLQRVPHDKRDGFFLGNMVPTVIDDDRSAARAIHRRTLGGYVVLPNYRNYWRLAGYAEEMAAIEAALAKGDRDAVAAAMSDQWLDDVTLSGSAGQVRDGVEEWWETGVTPILVPSSTRGGQMQAFEDLFSVWTDG